jgi:hypothetical protein
MRTDPPAANSVPDLLQVDHRATLPDRSELRSRSWPRRPTVIIAETMAMRGISEKVAVDVAEDILAALRRAGYSLYRADGLLSPSVDRLRSLPG